MTELNNKSEISLEVANSEPESESEVTTVIVQQEPEPGVKSSETPEQILVHVLEDFEPFVGTDMVTYSLHKEDLVTIPKQNADILEKNNKVKLVEPKI